MTAFFLAALLHGTLASSPPGASDSPLALPWESAAPLSQAGDRKDAGARERPGPRKDKRKKKKDEGPRGEEEVLTYSPMRAWTARP